MAGEAVERVAWAILVARRPNWLPEALELEWETDERLREGLRSEARAALEALRDPPPEIRALFDRDVMCGDGQLEDDWPDIIDALLR